MMISFFIIIDFIRIIIEPRHEVSYNVVCATSKASDQPAHMRSLIRAFASRWNILWVLSLTDRTSFGVSKLNRRLHRLVCVYTCQNTTYIVGNHMSRLKYSLLSLTQLCITQYYHLSRLDGLVPLFSPIYYCNSTTFISTTAKSIKLITRYEKLVPLINFSVFYNA